MTLNIDQQLIHSFYVKLLKKLNILQFCAKNQRLTILPSGSLMRPVVTNNLLTSLCIILAFGMGCNKHNTGIEEIRPTPLTTNELEADSGPCTVYGNVRRFKIKCTKTIESMHYDPGVKNGTSPFELIGGGLVSCGTKFQSEIQIKGQTAVGMDFGTTKSLKLTINLYDSSPITVIIPEIQERQIKGDESLFAALSFSQLDRTKQIHDLSEPGPYARTKLSSADISEEMQKAPNQRFHFVRREYFYERHEASLNFYPRLQDDVVVVSPGVGLLPLPTGQVLFSLSPRQLLNRIQDTVIERFRRAFITQSRLIDLDFLTELHHNTLEYLATLEIDWSEKGEAMGADLQFLAGLQAKEDQSHLPEKPLIFYEQVTNDQGIAELKPIFFLPYSLLQLREEEPEE